MQPQGGLSATLAAAHAGPVAAIGSPDEYIDKVKLSQSKTTKNEQSPHENSEAKG